MKTYTLFVLCSCPSEEVANMIARSLVKDRLAACVSILPEMRSVYRWQGSIESDAERLLLIKTTEERYPELETDIKSQHPYQIAEIIALPVLRGAADYLNWVQENTCKN